MLKKSEVEKTSKEFAYGLSSFIRQNYFSDYMLEVIRFDWNPRRKSSRGGIYSKGPGINIAMRSEFLQQSSDVKRFYEYRSYDASQVIGGFYYTNPQLKLKTIIAHEMAHTAQFVEYIKLNYRCKPHGPVFKKYYKDLRLNFINPYIEEQTSLKKEYESGLEYLFTGR